MNTLSKKIYYHDTDCGGVVYYANYLKYLEEARTEFLRDKGVDIKLLSEKGGLFAVKCVNIDYKTPARYADTLEITSQITKIKNASLEFIQEVKRNGQVLVTAATVLVYIDTNFQPKAMPEDIVKKLGQSG
ncbi:MAG: YbgC/FadM family acyl-CoA thioesterase [Candidatus Omnitrophota bacterium]|nr:YbgC/FadM family acyl-CoA thioesterase [Candidatus Omnitrophota bacterium]